MTCVFQKHAGRLQALKGISMPGGGGTPGNSVGQHGTHGQSHLLEAVLQQIKALNDQCAGVTEHFTLCVAVGNIP